MIEEMGEGSVIVAIIVLVVFVVIWVRGLKSKNKSNSGIKGNHEDDITGGKRRKKQP